MKHQNRGIEQTYMQTSFPEILGYESKFNIRREAYMIHTLNMCIYIYLYLYVLYIFKKIDRSFASQEMHLNNGSKYMVWGADFLFFSMNINIIRGNKCTN